LESDGAKLVTIEKLEILVGSSIGDRLEYCTERLSFALGAAHWHRSIAGIVSCNNTTAYGSSEMTGELLHCAPEIRRRTVAFYDNKRTVGDGFHGFVHFKVGHKTRTNIKI